MMPFRPVASILSTDSTHLLLRTASCVLAAATAPLAMELLVLTAGSLLPRRSREKRIHPVVPVAPLALTVVVPAHDEELLLRRCVDSLLADLPLGSSVLVVAHNCIDATARWRRNPASRCWCYVTMDVRARALRSGPASISRLPVAPKCSRSWMQTRWSLPVFLLQSPKRWPMAQRPSRLGMSGWPAAGARRQRG